MSVRRSAPSLAAACCVVGCAATDPVPSSALDDGAPAMLEAFFGLDDALPIQALGLCADAPGTDGMPVTFSHHLLTTAVDPAAFRVKTRSGALKTPRCATTRPAAEATENHTVLLIGDLGGAADPPVQVTVVAPLPLRGVDPAAAVGLAVDVTQLDAGPSLVLAFPLTADLGLDCGGGDQGVVVVWAGGVVPAPGLNDDDHRRAYRALVDGRPTTPAALGDLGDNDNYVHLCLDGRGAVTRVDVAGGVVIDPRGDKNPASSVDVAAPAGG